MQCVRSIAPLEGRAREKSAWLAGMRGIAVLAEGWLAIGLSKKLAQQKIQGGGGLRAS
jgi:hypothetical protein